MHHLEKTLRARHERTAEHGFVDKMRVRRSKSLDALRIAAAPENMLLEMTKLEPAGDSSMQALIVEHLRQHGRVFVLINRQECLHLERDRVDDHSIEIEKQSDR